MKLLLLIPLCLMASGCDWFNDPPEPIVETYSKDQLIPLAVGNGWRYDIPSGYLGHEFTIFKFDTITRVARLGYYTFEYHAEAYLGKAIWYIDARSINTFSVTENGLTLGKVAYLNGIESVEALGVLPKDPIVGDTLDLDGYQYIWVKQADVTVPAGTFTSCYVLKKIGMEVYYYFARGVGMVSTVISDKHVNLRSYTVK